MLAGCPALDKFVLRYIINGSSPGPQVPLSALHVSNIRVAEFGSCHFPEAIVNQVHFPNLQRLVLETVTISEGSLHAMLSGCPDLNSLTMGYSSGFHQFKINALKLKYVEMYFHGSYADRLQELIVENASCLETLHHKGPYEDNMHISIISAPKLKILGRLADNISRLELGTNVFKTPTAGKNTQRHCSRGRIECLDHHLKKLQISYYSGKRSHVEFAKFFVLNAGVLESLVLDVYPNKHLSGWWIEIQRRQLRPEKRASIGAQIDFTFWCLFQLSS